jgi:hypothetical protein
MTSNKINGLHINGNKTDQYKPANVETQPQPQSQPLAIDVTTSIYLNIKDTKAL